jgi:perosamine synthetase
MSIIREIPPTAGVPYIYKDLLSLFLNKKSGTLEDNFKDFLGVKHINITCSGTAALYIILQALKKLSGKKTVIIPSFVCPLVPLAIEKAGLKVSVCDITSEGFDFNLERLNNICLQNNDILAVIVAHLGGIPVDLDPIMNITKDKKIFVIEDCAQSLGASYKKRPTGTIGDFAFYSLCRGKGITIYEGGAITCKDNFSDITQEVFEEISINNYLSESLKILELFGYWAFYRPELFWFAYRLPQKFWEAQNKQERASIEYFTTDFPLHRVSTLRKSVGHTQWRRIKIEIGKQREKAKYYIEEISGTSGIKLILEKPVSYSNYPYLTIIFEEEAKQKKALALFKESGLGVSRIYLRAITDYRYLDKLYSPQSSPNAKSIAARHITLSTNTFLNKAEQNKIITILKRL